MNHEPLTSKEIIASLEGLKKAFEDYVKKDEEWKLKMEPIFNSVSELKKKIREEEAKLAHYEDIKQKTIDGWQSKIDESNKIINDLQAQLGKASKAGLEI